MSGTGSGANQGMLPPGNVWIDDSGRPTASFFELIRALWSRTGGEASPSGPGGAIGLAALQQQVAVLGTLIGQATQDSQLAIWLNDGTAGTESQAGSQSVSDLIGLLAAFGGDAGPAPDPGFATLLALALGDSGLDGTANVPPTPTGTVWAPLVNGDLPGPTLVADPYGQCIMVPIA